MFGSFQLDNLDTELQKYADMVTSENMEEEMRTIADMVTSNYMEEDLQLTNSSKPVEDLTINAGMFFLLFLISYLYVFLYLNLNYKSDYL